MTALQLAGVHVFLLASSRVLEPDLGDSLGQSCDLGDPLQVLPVRVRVQLEVSLENLELLLCEGGPHPLRLTLVVVGLAVSSFCNRESFFLQFETREDSILIKREQISGENSILTWVKNVKLKFNIGDFYRQVSAFEMTYLE